MRLNEMHCDYPLPWSHETNAGKMSAVVAANGNVVAGSLICEQGIHVAGIRQAHALIVWATNRLRVPRRPIPPSKAEVYSAKPEVAAVELLDGAYDIIETWAANSPSQKQWKEAWLKKARELGAIPTP